MDILSDILGHLNLKTSLYFRTALTPPWGVLVPAYRNVARFHIVVSGRFWVQLESDEVAHQVHPGDVLIVPHGKSHALKSDADSHILALEDLVAQSEHQAGEFLRYGPKNEDSTQLVCGHFEFEQESLHPLMRSLPPLIHLKESPGRDFGWLRTALEFIGHESETRESGASAVINRLSEIIFIQVLRHHMQEGSTDTVFLAALKDQFIGPSLEQIHAAPAKKWNLVELASVAGLSRTLFAERFSKLTGTSPMSYLTEWRMEIARKLLRNETTSVDEVADQVGYAASEAFQKRFKKSVGLTPSAYRKQHLQRLG